VPGGEVRPGRPDVVSRRLENTLDGHWAKVRPHVEDEGRRAGNVRRSHGRTGHAAPHPADPVGGDDVDPWPAIAGGPAGAELSDTICPIVVRTDGDDVPGDSGRRQATGRLDAS
jgi:hypothetical protein